MIKCNKTLIVLLVTVALFLTACTKKQVADKNGFVWKIPPILEYYKIYHCSECGAFSTEDHSGNELDVKTGQKLNKFFGGHGGGSSRLFYDENKELYGWYCNSEDDESFDLWPKDEFLQKNTWFSDRLNAIQKINSDKVKVEEHGEGEWVIKRYFLEEACINKKHAIAYGATFVTDFIYDYEDDKENNVRNIIVVRLNDKWGILDKDGNVVIPLCFEDIILIDEETAFAKYTDKYGILDINKTIAHSKPTP